MKTTILIAAASALLGALAGQFATKGGSEVPAGDSEARGEEAPPGEPGSRPVIAGEPEWPAASPSPEERNALEAEIAALRKDPRTWSEEQIQDRRAALLERLKKAKPSRDPWEVVEIAHELAALGPAGYADALDALSDRYVAMRSRDEAGLDEFVDACDGAVLEVMKWALLAPTISDCSDYRRLAAVVLTRHLDGDDRIPDLLLKGLAIEQPPGVAELLAGALPRAFSSAVFPDLAPTVEGGPGGRPDAVLAFLRGVRLSSWSSSEKAAVLDRLAESPSSAIRSAASATRAALEAGGAGFAIEWAGPESRALLGGLRPGDVVRTVDGEVPGGADHLSQLLSRVKPGESAVLRVWRDGEEFTLGWAGTSLAPRVSGFALHDSE